MHDPLTVAFEIKYPWRAYSRKERESDEGNQFNREWRRTYRNSFITVWHKDPERRGSDDSCNWFDRNKYQKRHGTSFYDRVNALPETERELFWLLEDILAPKRAWYRHPRWHFWHWRFQIHPFQLTWRWLFARCHLCHGRFAYGESPIGNWSGNAIWHGRCDQSAQPVDNQSA